MKKEPEEIKDIVRAVFEKISGQAPVEQERIQRSWEEVLEKEGLRHTKISGFKDNQLYVSVDSPAWLYQLNLKKKKILGQIQTRHPEVQKIFLKIGKVK